MKNRKLWRGSVVILCMHLERQIKTEPMWRRLLLVKTKVCRSTQLWSSVSLHVGGQLLATSWCMASGNHWQYADNKTAQVEKTHKKTRLNGEKASRIRLKSLHTKSSHLSSVSQTERRPSLQSTLFDTSAPSKASVLGCSLEQKWPSSMRQRQIIIGFPPEGQRSVHECVCVQPYFAHVFSMIEGFDRRWPTCSFSLGQTCKADTVIITPVLLSGLAGCHLIHHLISALGHLVIDWI